MIRLRLSHLAVKELATGFEAPPVAGAWKGEAPTDCSREKRPGLLLYSVQATEAVPAEPGPWLFPNTYLFPKDGLL